MNLIDPLTPVDHGHARTGLWHKRYGGDWQGAMGW